MSRFTFSDIPGKPGTLPFIELTLYYVGDDPHLANRLTVPVSQQQAVTRHKMMKQARSKKNERRS